MINSLNSRPSDWSSSIKLHKLILGASHVDIYLSSNDDIEVLDADEDRLLPEFGMLWIPFDRLVQNSLCVRFKGDCYLEDNDISLSLGLPRDEMSQMLSQLGNTTQNRTERMRVGRDRMEAETGAVLRNNTRQTTTIVSISDTSDLDNPFSHLTDLPHELPNDRDENEDLVGHDRDPYWDDIWKEGICAGLHACLLSLSVALIQKASGGYCRLCSTAASNEMYRDVRQIPNVYTRYQIIRVSQKEWDDNVELFFPCGPRIHRTRTEQGWTHLNYRNEWFNKVHRLNAAQRRSIKKALLHAVERYDWLPLPDKNKVFNHLLKNGNVVVHFPKQRGVGSRGINWQRVMLNPRFRLTRDIRSYWENPPIQSGRLDNDEE